MTAGAAVVLVGKLLIFKDKKWTSQNKYTSFVIGVIPYKSTEKNMTIFLKDFLPKKSKVFDILVIKTFFNQILVIFDHF